jgi:cytochrome bd ubiquinol oxidase subunit II
MMNALYLVNHVIFAVFMTLLLMEGGFAITALVAYEKYKARLMRYITPIWEVTGTFAVFYVVNFEATFPKLLGVAGTLYAVPLLVAAALIILRNAFLIHAEYVGDLKKEAKYLKIYAVATVAALILLLSVLSSAMTGTGISVSTGVSTLQMYLNPFNFIVIVSALLVSLSLAASVFRIERLERLAWLPLVLAVALFCIGISMAVPLVSASLASSLPLVAVFLALLLALCIARAKNLIGSGVPLVLAVFLALTLLGVVEYPYIFGSTNITGYLNSSALAGPVMLITLVGGAIVTVAFAYLVYLSYLKKEEG